MLCILRLQADRGASRLVHSWNLNGLHLTNRLFIGKPLRFQWC